jgi:hypothetical protein
MAFTREEVEQFIEALRKDAALRDRVRDAILVDDFRALPGIVRQLGERLERLTEQVDQLTERMDRLTERLEELAVQVGRLVSKVDHVDGRLGNVEGWQYEHTFTHNLSSRLGPYYRRVSQVVLADEEAVLSSLDSGAMTEREYQDVIRLESVARARPRQSEQDVIVAIEVSILIDTSDVSRAHRRAEILDRIFSENVQAVVAGQAILPSAAALAGQLDVRVLATPAESAA